MSKTAQRKREYFNQGKRDFEQGYLMSLPFFWRQHPLNDAYQAGYHSALRDRTLSVNDSLLQRIRVKFNMRSA